MVAPPLAMFGVPTVASAVLRRCQDEVGFVTGGNGRRVNLEGMATSWRREVRVSFTAKAPCVAAIRPWDAGACSLLQRGRAGVGSCILIGTRKANGRVVAAEDQEEIPGRGGGVSGGMVAVISGEQTR